MECKTGCSVRDLCALEDKKLTEETTKAYKKDKKIVKVARAPSRALEVSSPLIGLHQQYLPVIG